MHLGKNLTAILIGSMIAAAGCADGGTVTGSDTKAPHAPAYDGIGWAGSGNRTDTDSTSSSATGIGWAGSGNVVGTDSTTTTAPSATGIGWAGSGN